MSVVQLWEAHQSGFRTQYSANVYWDGVLQGAYKDSASAHAAVLNCLTVNREQKGKFLVGQSSSSFEGWMVTIWTCDVPAVQNSSIPAPAPAVKGKK